MKKALALACAAALMPVSASAATIFGVDETNRLVSFSSAAPGTFLSSVKITGTNSSIEALDFRPLNSTLYGLGTDRVVYTINTMTGVATAASAALGIEGSVFGFDFNPTIDRVRIVSNTNNNYVYNPNDGSLTGAPTTTTLGYAAGDPNAGRDPGVSAAAYTSSTFGAPGTSTQLYVIDTDLDVLAKQNNNGGVLTTVGGLGRDLGSRTSFDIAGNEAFAFNGRSLFSVNLDNGALSALGNTPRQLFGIAVAPVPEPATWAMMILGFGAIGYSMRRRSTVRFTRQIA
ncbi:DUF4394 domain-containing protein [Sphingomonas sp. BK235]|uniref:DUF4394 domain-containing protein n=1 Tax=Sphingomonas sp. BK235 TaxID=2512131 RepID=UPI001044D783|nr:DUF4394 domain-containing protein [Sphingomonas sp. BK235]TCP29517.1 putative secreted protein with PEP-CTERM sorting signal [Sphingomonas sp. BK235]